MGGCVSFFCPCAHHTHDPKGTTLVKDRECTDKLILLLWLAAWVGTALVISIASNLGGNPAKIINGIDFNGDICGYNSVVKSYPYAALVDPLSADPNAFNVWICVDDCSETENANNPYLSTLYGSTLFFGYCVPTFNISTNLQVTGGVKSQFSNNFDDLQGSINRGISDLANSWEIILASAFFALAFSYIYMWLAKKIAGIIIWLCILLVIVGGFFLGYAFLETASQSDVATTSPNRILAYKVAGYLFIALTLLFVLIILGLSHQINIAVEVVKEGSHAVNDMKLIVFFPIIPTLICGGYLVYWIYGCLYIFSVSTLETETTPTDCTTRDFQLGTGASLGWSGLSAATVPNSVPSTYNTFVLQTNYRPLAAYHVFHLLWTVQFFVYFGYMVIAGAVCAWYFTLSDASGNKIIGGETGGSHVPVLRSFFRTIRYHLGTIAFASLIIATVKAIRLTVKYIELKTRTNPPNYLQKAIFCLIQCCLKCIECCLDKISKNALVWCAMWGDPFLSSCCSSFALIWRNLSRVAAIHIVSEIILGIGKVAIACATVGLCALILNDASPWKTTVDSAFVPCILIFIISYSVAWLFFLTFETVIDTTFLCFLVDSENHEKSGEAMFASRGLQELIGKYQLKSAVIAEQHKKDAAEVYAHVNGAKVQDDHEAAVAHLQRAVSVKRAETGDPHATFGDPKQAWGVQK